MCFLPLFKIKIQKEKWKEDRSTEGYAENKLELRLGRDICCRVTDC
jgi:hypothetical protein